MRQFRTKAVRPVGIHILVEPLEEAPPEDAKLLTLDSNDEAPSIAQVLSLGSGGYHPQHGEFVIPVLPSWTREGNKTPGIQQGDVILVRKYSGAEVQVGKQKLLLITSDDVLGVVTGSFIGEGWIDPAEWTGIASVPDSDGENNPTENRGR